jgi:hypothetical protein
VIGVDASSNSRFGISVTGAKSLIKSCIARHNGFVGVVAEGGVQVQPCDASNKGGWHRGAVEVPRHDEHRQRQAFDGIDYQLPCPADVTFNTSTLGFPASYEFNGAPPCHTASNEFGEGALTARGGASPGPGLTPATRTG